MTDIDEIWLKAGGSIRLVPTGAVMKTIEENFIDWESDTFGYGYGSGEPHVLPALRIFFEHFGRAPDLPNSYDFRNLETALGGPVAWLLINALCHKDILGYGTSPRFGWLTEHGQALKDFILSKTTDELVSLCTEAYPNGGVHCYPNSCNCGPQGYQKDVKCPNPFWPNR